MCRPHDTMLNSLGFASHITCPAYALLFWWWECRKAHHGTALCTSSVCYYALNSVVVVGLLWHLVTVVPS